MYISSRQPFKKLNQTAWPKKYAALQQAIQLGSSFRLNSKSSASSAEKDAEEACSQLQTQASTAEEHRVLTPTASYAIFDDQVTL